MKHLNNVTLIAVDTLYPGKAAASLYRSLKEIKPARTLLLTDVKMELRDIEVVQIPKIKSKKEYSLFMIKELYKYFDTDYVLVTQADGWVLDGSAWDDRFYEFDFIGSLWLYFDGRDCGNGGASLRTKKLHTILGTDPFIEMYSPEDEVIGRLYRQYLEEKHGIKFPPDEIAEKFAFELREPVQSTFAFHGSFHKKYKPTVLLTRSGACGDIVQMEPVIRRFHEIGCQVVLDIPIYFMELFDQQEYPVKHISQFDHQRIPYYYVNLDLAYEKKPNQLHLKSYFEECQIEGELVNPKLTLAFDPKANENKIFKKYVVIHNPIRDEPHRNIKGFDWGYLADDLWKSGYEIIQIGIEEKQDILSFATQLRTPAISFLKWIISGADYFIGVDSGPANIAVALGVPSVIFSGSVDLRYIYADLSDICWIHNHEERVCETSFCWHHEVSTNGKDCVVEKNNPPCAKFSTGKTLEKIKNFINEQARKAETNNQHILTVSGEVKVDGIPV